MKITIDKILSFRPCLAWTRERMLEVSGERKSVDTSDLAKLDVSTVDLIWLTDQILSSQCNRDEYLLAAAFAERVLHLYESEYPGNLRPRMAIIAARQYALGEITIDELNDSLSAVYSVSAASAAANAAADAAYIAAAYAADADYAAAYAAYAAANAAANAADAAYIAAAYAADAADADYAASAASAANAAYAASAAERQAQREICAVFLSNI